MSVGIIGAGNVGMALAGAFVRHGEDVVLGVREPQGHQAAVQTLGDRARITTTPQAIMENDLVILAVPYDATASIAQSVPDWRGKILVDATNPLAHGLTGLTLGTTTNFSMKSRQRFR
jgi:predicted dinucleotide-binding enzyme